MGISRSISIGYGLAVADEDASQYLKTLADDDSAVYSILEVTGWDLIGYDYGGCYMTGETVHFFYVKGTEALHEEIDYLDPLTEFSDVPGVSLAVLRQLNEIADHFGIEGHIGWKLIFNVS